MHVGTHICICVHTYIQHQMEFVVAFGMPQLINEPLKALMVTLIAVLKLAFIM